MRGLRLGLLIICFLFAKQCRANDVIVSSKDRHGVIGSAYKSELQSLPGAECLKGPTAPVGTSSSSFDFKQHIEESELASELGLEVGGHARFGAYEASAEANFLNRSATSAFSIAAIYKGEYLFAPNKLLSDTAQYTGTSKPIVDNKNYQRWNEVCGDSFISELTKGGRLFFSIRVDFQSSTQQQQFSEKFNLQGPMLGVSQSLEEASKSFQKNVTITISGFQIGGDPSKLTSIFGTDPNDSNNFVQCSFGDFQKCSSVLSSAIKYATNPNTGFPSQLAQGVEPGPVDISYVVTPYTAYDRALVAPPGVSELIQIARDELSKMFEHSFWEFRQVNRLLELTSDPHREKELTVQKQLIFYNLGLEHKAADVCFEKPTECRDTVEKLSLKDVDDQQLLPETFRTYCTESLTLATTDPLRVSVTQIVLTLSPLFTIQDGLDCKVYEQLLAKRTYLSLAGKHISNLLPLAASVNLSRLILDDNEIEDIRPLASLRRLTVVSIDNNKVKSLAPLSSLDQLYSISAANNQITTIEPLSQLSLLHDLTVPNNLLANVKGLKTLQRLRFLDISGNNITDLTEISDGAKRLGCISLANNLLLPNAIDTLRNEHPGIIVVQQKGIATAKVPFDFECQEGDEK